MDRFKGFDFGKSDICFPNVANAPTLKIIHQPMPIYRMRYKTDSRNTCLLADVNNESLSDDDDANDEGLSSIGQPSQNQNPRSTRKTKKIYPELEVSAFDWDSRGGDARRFRDHFLQ